MTAVDLRRHQSAESSLRTGLHGHRLDAGLLHCAVVEAIGTWVLALMITATVVAVALASPPPDSVSGGLAVAAVGGVTLAALVTGLGSVSGAHLNPAVTISVALSGRLPWRRVPAYVTGQLIGAMAAAGSVWSLYGSDGRTAARLGAPAPAAGASTLQAIGAESMATFFLVLVILTATNRRQAVVPLAPLAIGAALAAGIAFSGPVSGAGLNPALATGPMIVADQFRDWWVYVLAPIAGGAVAAATTRLARDEPDGHADRAA